MAAGKRPVPFRTRKLSPPAPMVLPPGGSGRVGYRRPNNFTQHTRCKHHAYSGCFAIRAPSIPRGVWVDPRIADNHDGTHHWRTPMKSPGRNHPAGRDRSTRGHIGRGDSTRSHDDADSGAKVEYRTSSTPAYTDRLDLHYSTNNAPTKTWGRARLRIADNCACTNNGYPPTKAWAPPKPALRTTTTGPIIGPRTRMLSPALPAPVPHEPASDRSIAPTEFSTPGNRGARAPRGSSWIAPRARLSCGRVLAWTTGAGGSTSGPR